MNIQSYNGLRYIVVDTEAPSDFSKFRQRMERHIGALLPEDFCEFLAFFGGRRVCTEGYAVFKLSTGEESFIDQFLGFNDEDEGLLTYFEMTRGRVHPDLMPIGIGPECFILMGFRGSSWGKVFYYEDVGLPGDITEDDQSTTRLIAESFTQFLGLLRIEFYD